MQTELTVQQIEAVVVAVVISLVLLDTLVALAVQA
jgi:hypothetical protein